jgi:hypothetical protein
MDEIKNLRQIEFTICASCKYGYYNDDDEGAFCCKRKKGESKILFEFSTCNEYGYVCDGFKKKVKE